MSSYTNFSSCQNPERGLELNVNYRNYRDKIQIDFYHNKKRIRKTLDRVYTDSNVNDIKNNLESKIVLKLIQLNENKIQKQIIKNTSFDYYASIFLKQKEKLKSYNNRVWLYNKIIKFFKDYDVTKITRLHIKQYIDSLNISNNEKNRYLGVIRDILDLAVDDMVLINNVCIGIKIQKERQKFSKIDYFTKDEVFLLLNDKKDLELNTYITIILQTGLRAEETIALRFSDIKNGFAKIQRVKTKGIVDDIMKTNSSNRIIPFNIDVSSLDTKSFYLFPNIKDVESWRTRWKNLLIRNNIRHRGINQLRHTFATYILRDEILTINELSGVLGHAKVSTTLTHYASVIDSKDDLVNSKLKSLNWSSVSHQGKIVNL